MFWATFEMLCNSVGKAPSVVAAEIGIKSTGTVPGWKRGVKPRPSALRALADYFGVTVEYLLTGEGQKNSPAPEGAELTDTQKEAMEFVLSLSDDQLRQFIRIGRAILEGEE